MEANTNKGETITFTRKTTGPNHCTAQTYTSTVTVNTNVLKIGKTIPTTDTIICSIGSNIQTFSAQYTDGGGGWTSSDPSVASINSNPTDVRGQLSTIKPGDVVIKLTRNYKGCTPITKFINVHVKNPPAFSINSTNIFALPNSANDSIHLCKTSPLTLQIPSSNLSAFSWENPSNGKLTINGVGTVKTGGFYDNYKLTTDQNSATDFIKYTIKTTDGCIATKQYKVQITCP